jgi:hypothetical protein
VVCVGLAFALLVEVDPLFSGGALVIGMINRHDKRDTGDNKSRNRNDYGCARWGHDTIV